jgi:hypothetical protein
MKSKFHTSILAQNCGRLFSLRHAFYVIGYAEKRFKKSNVKNGK